MEHYKIGRQIAWILGQALYDTHDCVSLLLGQLFTWKLRCLVWDISELLCSSHISNSTHEKFLELGCYLWGWGDTCVPQQSGRGWRSTPWSGPAPTSAWVPGWSSSYLARTVNALACQANLLAWKANCWNTDITAGVGHICAGEKTRRNGWLTPPCGQMSNKGFQPYLVSAKGKVSGQGEISSCPWSRASSKGLGKNGP